MKKIVLILMIAISAFCQQGFPTFPKDKGFIKSGTVSYLLQENFEGSGTPIGWNSLTGSVNYDYSTGALEGSESMLQDASGGSTGITTVAVENSSEMWGHFVFETQRPSGSSATLSYLMYVRNSSNGTLMMMYIKNTDKLTIYDTGDRDQGTITISANTPYYVWWHYKAGSGANAVYETWVSTTPTKPGSTDASYSSGASAGDVDNLRITVNSGTNNIVKYDNVIISNTVIGNNP